MYLCRAVNLLDAISTERRVTTSFASARAADGEQLWVICALGQDGQQWRSQHSDLLLAVLMLDNLLSQDSNEVACRPLGGRC